MKERVATTLTILLILGFSSASNAEYLIYLKGGHYIVADNCTFSTRQEMRKDTETEEKTVFVEDCTKGKPEGRIFWSTIDGKFGEVNADDVYAIFGSRNLAPIKPPSASLPLEDYLITSRGESFVNAKVIEQEKDRIYGVKRDELARVDRRVVIEIAPEGSAKSRSGEGLCPGEPAEFSVSEVELVGGNLVGVVTNLSQTLWRPWFEVEVREKGGFKGKFRIPDSRDPEVNIVPPGESTAFDGPVPGRFLKYLERVTDPEASVRLCYRKVKTGPRQPTVEQSLTVQPGK